MCSYNKINHKWSCENPETLTTHLRDYLGFEGFVMSDWGATHSPSVKAGLDQEMNNEGYEFYNENDFKHSNVTEADLDKSVFRIFNQFFKLDILDHPRKDNVAGNVRRDWHSEVAQKVAEDSMVLLKNKDVCPAVVVYAIPFPAPDNAFNVHMIGQQLGRPVIAGGGSGIVHENNVTTPLDAMCDYLNVTRINPNVKCAVQSCNDDNGNCVVYNPTFATNNDANPYGLHGVADEP